MLDKKSVEQISGKLLESRNEHVVCLLASLERKITVGICTIVINFTILFSQHVDKILHHKCLVSEKSKRLNFNGISSLEQHMSDFTLCAVPVEITSIEFSNNLLTHFSKFQNIVSQMFDF